MAEETKTTTTRSRKPKAEVSQEDIIAQLMAKIEELQNKIDNQPQSNYIRTEENFGGKKIKVISLVQGILNLSTEPDGQGRVYTFNKYSDSRMIRFDDLNDIISNYPVATEEGYFYITNKDVVKYFDLEEEYSKIYTKEMIDGIIKLQTDSDVDFLLGMNKDLRESTIMAIAERINSGERMDYNNLRRIKDEINVDIEDIANKLKENFQKKK